MDLWRPSWFLQTGCLSSDLELTSLFLLKSTILGPGLAQVSASVTLPTLCKTPSQVQYLPAGPRRFLWLQVTSLRTYAPASFSWSHDCPGSGCLLGSIPSVHEGFLQSTAPGTSQDPYSVLSVWDGDRIQPEKQLEGGEKGGAGNRLPGRAGAPAVWSGGRQRRLLLPAWLGSWVVVVSQG